MALLGSCCVAVSARADGFTWDLSGDVAQGSLGDIQDTDSAALVANHYFAPVDDSRGPYELAAFLDPASRISASASHQRVTFHPIGIVLPPGATFDSTSTTDNYAIGGRYVLPASKWYAGGDYTKGIFDSSFGVHANSYRVLAGKYLGPNTSLELEMSRAHTDVGQFADSTSEIVGSSFVHVRHFRSFAYSLFGGISQTSSHATFPSLLGGNLSSTSPRIWTYSFGTELFPTTKLGFRVGYTRADGQFARGDSYDVAATWFLKRKIGVELGWSQARSDSTTPRSDGANLRFVGRF